MRAHAVAIAILLLSASATARADSPAGGISDGSCQPDSSSPIADLGATVAQAQKVAASTPPPPPYDVRTDPDIAFDDMLKQVKDAPLQNMDNLAREHRRKIAKGTPPPTENADDALSWAIGEVASIELARRAAADPNPSVPPSELAKIPPAKLQRFLTATENGLSKPTTRECLSSSGTLAPYILHAERLRQELDRRAFPEGAIPPEVRPQVMARIRAMLARGYNLKHGFTEDLGHGIQLQFGGLNASGPVFLRLSETNTHLKGSDGKIISKNSGKFVLIQVAAQPRVMRIDWQPSESVKGGIDLLAARGTMDLSTGGINAEAIAYLAGADLQAGPVSVRGYAGGLGVKLKLTTDGKIDIGAAVGLGGSVSVDLVAILNATYSDHPFPDDGPKWVSTPRSDSPGAGYYEYSSGTIISGSSREGADYARSVHFSRCNQ